MPLLGKYLWPGTRRPTIRAEVRPDGRDVMLARGDWKRLLALEVSAFGFFGLFWGCFAVLLADLSGALGLSPGPLGVALFVGAGASIAAMAALGWTSDRLGRDVPDPGGLRLRDGNRGTRPLGLLRGPASDASGPLLLERSLRRGDKRRGGGPGAYQREALHVLPARGLLRRGDGWGLGSRRPAAGRGGLPAGVPGAAAALGLTGGDLRGGPVAASRGRRDRQRTTARRGNFRRRVLGGRGR